MEKDSYILDLENKGLKDGLIRQSEIIMKKDEEIARLKKYKEYYEEQMK